MSMNICQPLIIRTSLSIRALISRSIIPGSAVSFKDRSPVAAFATSAWRGLDGCAIDAVLAIIAVRPLSFDKSRLVVVLVALPVCLWYSFLARLRKNLKSFRGSHSSHCCQLYMPMFMLPPNS